MRSETQPEKVRLWETGPMLGVGKGKIIAIISLVAYRVESIRPNTVQ